MQEHETAEMVERDSGTDNCRDEGLWRFCGGALARGIRTAGRANATKTDARAPRGGPGTFAQSLRRMEDGLPICVWALSATCRARRTSWGREKKVQSRLRRKYEREDAPRGARRNKVAVAQHLLWLDGQSQKSAVWAAAWRRPTRLARPPKEHPTTGRAIRFEPPGASDSSPTYAHKSRASATAFAKRRQITSGLVSGCALSPLFFFTS